MSPTKYVAKPAPLTPAEMGRRGALAAHAKRTPEERSALARKAASAPRPSRRKVPGDTNDAA